MTQVEKSKIFNAKDLIAYFLVAGTGAVIQLVSSSLIQDWFGISWSDSIVPSYLVGLIWGFILTKLFAFDARRSNQTRREMVKFFMVATFSLFVTKLGADGSYYIVTHYLGYDIYEAKLPFGKKDVNITEMVCYIFGQGCSFVSNYILHKTFTFKSTGFYNRLKVLIR
ncbi:GtrA family protein [Dyadobacter sp. Leaf189]|uniref:GtrA family protein n=1 Tax=Dyadobacter sp. Leaf189 TaxID=1736295 RepID=UPI0006FAB9E3|nr:GtrA family protein [Dyadobacter sp. Leaf189]KQS31055.1 polysaccharide synthesis protein GtrA [Dyadobacter sp. Leaf189]